MKIKDYAHYYFYGAINEGDLKAIKKHGQKLNVMIITFMVENV